MSPIRPENVGRYPAEWKAIRAAILERAGNRCECRGECGAKHDMWGGLTGPDGVRRTFGAACKAPNGALVVREIDNKAAWHEHDECPCDRECSCPDRECLQNFYCMDYGEHCYAVRVVLTVAHLDHTPENNDPTNLRAFCQFCHNRYDRAHRNATAATTRHRRRASADLFTAGGASPADSKEDA